MAKDERLFMTFPNDLHRHPKIKRLSVEARWAFIEMNGEARLADNDGRFQAEDAEFLWPEEVLAELLASHPVRPLVIRDGTDYVIREYAKHQQTRADRESLSAKRAEAGRKGGLARAQAASTAPAPAAETLSEVQRRVASQLGLDVPRIRAKIADLLGIDLTLTNALMVGAHILSKPSTAPRAPTAYVLGSITRSPAEIEKYIHESNLTS